jgi:ATP-binding cassette subfamily C protein
VRLAAVHFAYDGGPEVLAGVEIEIPAGQITALVGPSGAGKTTVADVVAGLLHPTAGRLEVDGAPLDDAAWNGWRRGIGYVTQDTVIFRDTVRANLAWVRPEATEGEMWEALRMAAADGFVARLPRGLDTELAERGGGLSGGERQRLALARALLRGPELLILDEATSSLDAESEARVLEAVQGLRGRVTVLVATHRLSTLRIADRIYLMEGGRVAESGTWESLRREGARFRRLLGEER